MTQVYSIFVILVLKGVCVRGLTANAPHRLVIGMVHLDPLPGTPLYQHGSLPGIVRSAVEDAVALRDAGADACLVQTVDRLYSSRDEADPARIGAVTLVAAAIREAAGGEFPMGVQLMRNAVRASLAVASVADGSFVRATAIVGATMTAHGLVEADPLSVMSYRRMIGADEIPVIADVWTDHFSWFGGGKTAGEVARLAAGVGASAVAVSDKDVGAALSAVADVRNAVPSIPVILAAHTRHETVPDLLPAVDGVLVGSCIKRADGTGRIDRRLAERYVGAVRSATE
jgi:membrane complex biogenesis BtpA family protein